MRIIPLILLFLTGSMFFTPAFAQKENKEYFPGLLCPGSKTVFNKPFIPFSLFNDEVIADNNSVTGKVVLINFWFEGCHPCMAEMEALNAIYLQLKDNPGFVFLSLTWDNPEAIKRVKEKYSLQFDVFRAPAEECQRLNFGCGYPTSVILDKKGIVKFWHSGGSTNKEKASKMVMSSLLPEILALL